MRIKCEFSFALLRIRISEFATIPDSRDTSSTMEITTLEDDAKARAAKHVANMLHAPDKLEKVRN